MTRLFRIALALVASLVTLAAGEAGLRVAGLTYSPIQIGANVQGDFREEHAFRDRHLSCEDEAHLRAIIAAGRARGIPFVGSAADPSSWKAHAPAYNARTLRVAQSEGVPAIDVHGAFTGRPDLFDDESHFGVTAIAP